MTQKILFGIIAILFIGVGYIGITSVLNNQAPEAGDVTNTYTDSDDDMQPSSGAQATSTDTTTSTDSSQTPAAGTYALADIASHNTQSSCWTAVGGNVYDLTSFVSAHPGGVENIMKVCGVDGTATFAAQHGSNENAQAALASLKIGILAQ